MKYEKDGRVGGRGGKEEVVNRGHVRCRVCTSIGE